MPFQQPGQGSTRVEFQQPGMCAERGNDELVPRQDATRRGDEAVRDMRSPGHNDQPDHQSADPQGLRGRSGINFQQPGWPEVDESQADRIAADQTAVDIAGMADYETRRLKARRKAEQKVDADEQAESKVVGIRGDTLEVRRTKWLWRDRTPVGGLSLLAGKGDVSKSTLFALFAAWLTTGEMKGEYYEQPRDIGYVVNEDSLHETVVPRMIAAGADMTRVHFLGVHGPLGADALSLPRDAELLKDFIRDNNLACTFIDPLSANVTGKGDTKDTRAVYQVVNRIAEDSGCCIWGLAHTRKASAADVVEAVMGSSEQVNVARSVHGLVQDPAEDGARVLSCEKLNVGQKHLLPSLRFKVNSVWIPCTDGTGDMTSMPQIEWLEEMSGETASDIMGDQYFGNQNIDGCVEWLNAFLIKEGGEAYTHTIKEMGKNFSDSMLARARKKLGVKSTRTREVPSRTVWSLPNSLE